MPTSPAEVLDTIALYADKTAKALSALGVIVQFFRALSDDEVRAQRLRRQAARLYRVALRADGHGYHRRARAVRARALGKWTEAQHLHPLGLQAAVDLDRGVA